MGESHLSEMVHLLVNLVLLACASSATASTAGGDNDPYGTAGEYDLLIFARFWMGEPSTDIACGSFAASNLTVHGLWPQYTEAHEDSHLWPQFCNASSAATGVSDRVQQKMLPLWQQYARSYPDTSDLKYKGLAEHEWNRHGVCWNSSVNQLAASDDLDNLQIEFFERSMDLVERFPTPAILGNALRSNTTIALADLQAAFGGKDMVTLQCTKDGQLSMVSLCFDKQLSKQITCPDSVLQEAYQNSCVVPKIVDPVTVAFDCSPN